MMNIDTNDVAKEFMDYLVSEGIYSWDDEEIKETFEEMKEDMAAAYKVAPRLVNALADMFDK